MTINSELLTRNSKQPTAVCRPPSVYEPERKGEIRRNYSDISKARAILGFEPKSKVEEGLGELWRLHKARRGAKGDEQ